jgi:uncharacterized PurR-regulated membrane protein YhhQ (DUF165 family)
MYLVLYVLSVVLANFLFSALAPVQLFGALVPPASLIAGVVFVARDFAHRSHPRAIWPCMLLAGLASALLAEPRIALASFAAFAVSELVDALVFVRARGSFRRRVVMSSFVAVPLDTILFLTLALGTSIDLVPSAILVCASKLVALLAIVRHRARA